MARHAGTSADRDDAPGLAALTADLLDEGTASLTMIGVARGARGHRRATRHRHRSRRDRPRVLALSSHRERASNSSSTWRSDPASTAADMARVCQLRLNRLRQLRHSGVGAADLLFMRRLYGCAYGRMPASAPKPRWRFAVDDVRVPQAALRPAPRRWLRRRHLARRGRPAGDATFGDPRRDATRDPPPTSPTRAAGCCSCRGRARRSPSCGSVAWPCHAVRPTTTRAS